MNAVKNEFLEAIIRYTEKSQIRHEDDYYNSDGLLICEKCRTPKQSRLKKSYGDYIVPVACKCKLDEYNAMQEKQRLKECEEARKRYIEHEKCRNYRFAQDDGRYKNITQALEQYCAEFDKVFKKNLGLILHGPVGTGKTFYAGCIANKLIDGGYSVVMTDLLHIIDYLNPFGKKQSKREEYEEHLKKCDLLILDDLSAERDTEYVREGVYRIIDMRYASEKPLIVTTNLTKEQLTAPDHIDKRRVYNRIEEICHFIEISGESRRTEMALKRTAKVNKFLGLS